MMDTSWWQTHQHHRKRHAFCISSRLWGESTNQSIILLSKSDATSLDHIYTGHNSNSKANIHRLNIHSEAFETRARIINHTRCSIWDGHTHPCPKFNDRLPPLCGLVKPPANKGHGWVFTPNSFFMMTSSNGNIFRVTGPLCGEFTGPGEFPAQRPVTRSFDVFFDLRLNKRLSKQW